MLAREKLGRIAPRFLIVGPRCDLGFSGLMPKSRGPTGLDPFVGDDFRAWEPTGSEPRRPGNGRREDPEVRKGREWGSGRGVSRQSVRGA